MVGFDKFFAFIDPQCSLKDNIPTSLWKLLGGLQIAAGILIFEAKRQRDFK